jgi:hypothetical protein
MRLQLTFFFLARRLSSVYSSSFSFISKSESDSGGANVGAGTTTEGLGVSDLALLTIDWRRFGFEATSAAFSTGGDWYSGGPRGAKVSSSSVTSHESVRQKEGNVSHLCLTIFADNTGYLVQDF